MVSMATIPHGTSLIYNNPSTFVATLRSPLFNRSLQGRWVKIRSGTATVKIGLIFQDRMICQSSKFHNLRAINHYEVQPSRRTLAAR